MFPTNFRLAEILVLAGSAVGMAPSTRISVKMKRVTKRCTGESLIPGTDRSISTSMLVAKLSRYLNGVGLFPPAGRGGGGGGGGGGARRRSR